MTMIAAQARLLMPKRRPIEPIRWLVLPLLLAGMLAAHGARAADDYTEVQRLAGAGQAEQALALADRYIGAHPRDPQMRFIKANLLSRSGQAEQARQLLIDLTRDYPELAEPWNNLAVLHAAQGQLEQAQDALLAALRIQPDYATARQNLGDVRARLALQDYQKAQKLNASDPLLGRKIKALDELLGKGEPGTR